MNSSTAAATSAVHTTSKAEMGVPELLWLLICACFFGWIGHVLGGFLYWCVIEPWLERRRSVKTSEK